MKFVRALIGLATVMSLLIAFAVLTAAPAAAQDFATCVDGKCAVDIGNVVQFAADHLFGIVASLVLALYSIALRSLPSNIAGILKTFRVDQLLIKAVTYGISMVVDATRDKKWNVDLGSSIIAHAIEYALSKMPEWMRTWIGPLDNLISMVIARIEPYLEDGVDGSALKSATLSKLSAPGAAATPIKQLDLVAAR